MDSGIEKSWTTESGLSAVVLMNNIGFRCGYVGIDEDHPLYRVNYASSDILDSFNVHGGLTFSDFSKRLGDKNLWWFGYDCGHIGDIPSKEYIGEYKRRVHSDYWHMEEKEGTHKSLEYCVQECENLARQLSEYVV